jgi:hypothetical protein
MMTLRFSESWLSYSREGELLQLVGSLEEKIMRYQDWSQFKVSEATH